MKTNARLFMEPDFELARHFRETGHRNRNVPDIVNFTRLLRHTDFPKSMENVLAVISHTYDYPVDIEFTCNFDKEEHYRISLLQCRPLQTKGLGKKTTLWLGPKGSYRRSRPGRAFRRQPARISPCVA